MEDYEVVSKISSYLAERLHFGGSKELYLMDFDRDISLLYQQGERYFYGLQVGDDGRFIADDNNREFFELYSTRERGPFDLPKTNVKGFVNDLATRNRVVYFETEYEKFAEQVNRLTDNVDTDETEKLIHALGKAGVLSSEESTQLFVNYLREEYEAE